MEVAWISVFFFFPLPWSQFKIFCEKAGHIRHSSFSTYLPSDSMNKFVLGHYLCTALHHDISEISITFYKLHLQGGSWPFIWLLVECSWQRLRLAVLVHIYMIAFFSWYAYGRRVWIWIPNKWRLHQTG